MTSFTQKILVTSGALILIGSCFAAVVWHYNHFYEFTLLGLLLILVPFVPKDAFTQKRIINLYLWYICAALVVDLLLSLIITKVWYYHYTSIVEYAVLYVWIYPAGGFVLTIPYLIGRKYFDIQSSGFVIDKRIFQAIFTLFLAATIILILIKGQILFAVWGPIFLIVSILALCALSSLRSELRGRPSYVRDLIVSPGHTLLVTTLATLPNLIIHEYPNVYAHQWTYILNTGSAMDILLLGIPLLVWVAWPLLVVGSVSIYYQTEPQKTHAAI